MAKATKTRKAKKTKEIDLLEIPDFLKRAPKRGPKKKFEEDKLAAGYLRYANGIIWKTDALRAEEAAEKAVEAKKNRSEAAKAKGDTRNVQEKIRDQVNEYVAELEGIIDEFVLAGYKSNFNSFKWFNKKQIKSMQAGRIADYYEEQNTELQFAANGSNDKVQVEGYGLYTAKELAKIAEFYDTLYQDCRKWQQNSKKVSGKRKKKKKSVEATFRHFNYKTQDADLKIVSVDPALIEGAQVLYIYNTKQKKLGVLNALDRGGFQIHRSAVRNIDPSQSYEKRVSRNIIEIMQTIIDGGKITSRNTIRDCKGKVILHSGRIGSDTVLLKVIK